ncbi:NAD(P)-binding protein [Hypoxylon sp. NC1633]|nr:NAD(P)-binding protein [Hypoxylon sp. NC1633]
MSSPNETKKSIVFFGASTGVGLAALTRALAANYTCTALCRKPSKLLERFPASQYPNLRVVEGNAHDSSVVARCLYDREHSEQLPCSIVSSIGSVFIVSRMTLEDPHVCGKGMEALQEAIALVRKEVGAGPDRWSPRVIVLSTCGINKAGRDYPIVTMPIYKIMLKVPHIDKRAMERDLVARGADLGYTYTIVRPSLLTDDPSPKCEIRVGIDDKFPVGYAISRDDTGRWIFENLLDVEGQGATYENRIATITW